MALHYDFRIPGERLGDSMWDGEGDEATLKPVYQSIIWLTISVDIGHIKDEKTALEFLTRIRILERFAGKGFWHSEGQDVPFPAKAVYDMIGLETNVGFRTRHQWLTRQAKYEAERVEIATRREVAEMKEVTPDEHATS